MYAIVRFMDAMTEKTIEALETLPDSFRKSVAAYVIEQAEKYRALKAAIDEGMADVEAGRVREWNSEEFLQRARSRNSEAKS